MQNKTKISGTYKTHYRIPNPVSLHTRKFFTIWNFPIILKIVFLIVPKLMGSHQNHLVAGAPIVLRADLVSRMTVRALERRVDAYS
jgi:hypothetical protein